VLKIPYPFSYVIVSIFRPVVLFIGIATGGSRSWKRGHDERDSASL